MTALAEFIDPMMVRAGGERINTIHGVHAASLREFSIDDSHSRAISVLDECTYDREGNKHPAHAHIAICENWQERIDTKSDANFIAIQEGLKLIFQQQELWRRPAADP